VLTLNPLDLFPPSAELELRHVILDDDAITFVARTAAPVARCPACGHTSSRIHSRYRRCLAGLPWCGRSIRLDLMVRRFACDTPDCPRRIFAERLPELAATHARSTVDLHETHTQIGVAAGGEGGARLAARLAMPTSPDTLLRRVRRAALRPGAPVRVVGVDDWAFRKGHRYGTILVDLEQRCPIDLLPERSAEALCAWLQVHPEVEVISRDRGDDMIRGATAGAPQATQVADRWHLLRNLKDALTGTVDRHHSEVRAAANKAAADCMPAAPAIEARTPAGPGASARDPTSARVERREARRARRRDLFEQARDLHAKGVTLRQIARRLGIHRATVRRLVNADSFPERAGRPARRSTDPFREHLRRRWEEGCRNAARLFEELRGQGFGGSYYAVRRHLAQWRRAGADATRPGKSDSIPNLVARPSARRVTWILLREDADLEPEERAFRERLFERSPALRRAADLARDFRRMVRERREPDWDEWLARAAEQTSAQELRSFAEGLKKDEAAVRAALRLEWSNGQVEGQVNRLKLIKRQMYGRANFDLLRKRVLLAA
jgi:transposase